ncbi:MAG: phosphopentomutase [Lachnospiraceae bacterium]|nr:phosphopentomutase [Lachnospiraceae bacterium]
MTRRVIWIVLDSVGCGEAPDADKFDDVGSDTIGHILKEMPDTELPTMKSIGLYAIDGTSFNDGVTDGLIGCYGKARERSVGKDTTTGHWEMIGIHTATPFPTYPDGFPDEIMDAFVKETGCGGYLCNKPASGVAVINEYGDEHMKTGYPIVYTSADSVFQIAASEEKVGVEKLYEWCEIARRILVGKHGVGRVIARPFVTAAEGENKYVRTANRHDYALLPQDDNVLMHLKEKGVNVAAVGKIVDIFKGSGISVSVHTSSNDDGMAKTLEYMQEYDSGLIFTNLVDFDMVYGHRRDVKGYRDGLVAYDKWLGELIPNLKDEDIIIMNADHGCDPTYKGTDHTREFIPVLMYGKGLRQGVNLGTCDTFADIGKTVEEYLTGSVKPGDTIGESFLDRIL